MISANKIYEGTMMLLNKGLRGFATPARFNIASEQAELWLFNTLLGRPEEFQPGRAVPRIAYGMNRKVNRSLSPFKEGPVTLQVISPMGIYALPEDCEYPIGAYNRINNRPFDEVTDDEFPERVSSALKPATEEYPIISFGADTARVAPLQGVSPALFYLRLPRPGKWAYTLVNGRPVYDANASTNYEWLPGDANRLIERIVFQLGENQKAQDLMQISNSKIATGN